MGLNSIPFVFFLLPVTIVLYFALYKKRKLQNTLLVIISLIFYAWGEKEYTLILAGSVVVNYFMGFWISKARDQKAGIKWKVTVAVLLNLAILFAFKYVPFTVTTINGIFGSSIPVPNMYFPVGISFYTFQAISYIIDVRRGRVEPQRNFIDMALYITFFPKLLIGPITRYNTMAAQFQDRKESLEGFSKGACRFIIGLGKKVVISGLFNSMTIYVFSQPSNELSVALSWLGMLGASFNIYFDFAGYSDMAIGLGKMFGFDIPENFNYPYIATSIADFWRRWHMSMSAWFRDYVFMPVTVGERFKFYPLTKKRIPVEQKIVIATFITWLCTGIWHGTTWAFVIWGMYYFVLMQIENALPKFKIRWLGAALGFIATQILVRLGQILTRADGLSGAVNYYKSMLGLAGNTLIDDTFFLYFNDIKYILPVAILASMPTIPFILKYIKIPKSIQNGVYAVSIIGILFVTIVFLVESGYVPAIYTKF